MASAREDAPILANSSPSLRVTACSSMPSSSAISRFVLPWTRLRSSCASWSSAPSLALSVAVRDDGGVLDRPRQPRHLAPDRSAEPPDTHVLVHRALRDHRERELAGADCIASHSGAPARHQERSRPAARRPGTGPRASPTAATPSPRARDPRPPRSGLARKLDPSEGGVGLRAPRRVARERGRELRRLGGRALGELEQLVVLALDPEARRLHGQTRQRLAPGGRQPRLGRELHGPLQVLPHPRRVAGGRTREPAPRLQATRAERGRMLRGDRRRPVEPRSSPARPRPCRRAPSPCRRPPGTRASDRRSPRACACACSPSRERQIRDHLRAREHVDPVEHLRLERRALALVREGLRLRGQPTDLLDVPCRARAQVDVRRPVQVAHAR